MIPIADLMQVRHPGYRVFLTGRDMDREHYPTFLNYCIEVDKKFRYYAEEYGSHYDNHSLSKIAMLMHQLEDEDNPYLVFPIREHLRDAVYEFKHHCDRMGAKFTRPDSIREFYAELGDLVIDMVFDYAGMSQNQYVVYN